MKFAYAVDATLPLAEIEKRHIIRTLVHFDYDVLQTRKSLGIGNGTIYRKLREYGIRTTGNGPMAPDVLRVRAECGI